MGGAGRGSVRAVPGRDQAIRREGLVDVRFEQADAQVADLGAGRYDRVISRNGVMFFGDPDAAFANLARSLKPDGRLVLLVWQRFEENEWLREFRRALAVGRDIPPPPPDGPGAFSLGDPARVHALWIITADRAVCMPDRHHPHDPGL